MNYYRKGTQCHVPIKSIPPDDVNEQHTYKAFGAQGLHDDFNYYLYPNDFQICISILNLSTELKTQIS